MRKIISRFALLCAVILLLASCSSDEKPKPRANSSTTQPTYATQTTSSNAGGCEELATCDEDLASSAPTSGGVNNSNYTYTVKEYLEWVVFDADKKWTDWFATAGLKEPYVGYNIISSNSGTYTSNCTQPNGKSLTVTDTTPNAFYCPLDNLVSSGVTYKGVIILPETTFYNMWFGDIFGQQSTVSGDFAAAGIVAHEFGHHVQDEIAIQLSIQPPAGKYKELIADCFSGNWVFSVYNDRNLDTTDLSELVAALNTMGDATANANDHGTSAERVRALQTGLSGNPVDCIKAYWPAAA